MASSHNNLYMHDPYAKERDHSSNSSHYSASEKSASHSSRFNGSNKFCEEYSFNRQASYQRESQRNEPKERHVYRPHNIEEGDSVSNRNPELLKKYSSIFNELQDIDSQEVIHLFLEQIEQNEQYRNKIIEMEVRTRGLEEENQELKALIEKKREDIRRLCQAESNSLNIIECLQRQTDRTFNLDSHYLSKYQELEAYMNEYISSTNEAQEEFSRGFSLLKTENIKLQQISEKLQRESFDRERELQVARLRQMKCTQSLGVFREKERNMMIQIDNLQEENMALQKSVEELAESVRANQQFEVELTKENRELSSELDFIREKINENQSLSRDIFEKIESHSEQIQRLNKEKQQLENLLTKSTAENESLLNQKNETEYKLETLLKEFNEAITTNEKLMFQAEEREKQMESLKAEIQMIRNQEQELFEEYQNEKESKHLIKSQLIDLAEQVKFMESTYKKEIIQNEKIKMELQRFWERSTVEPLKEHTSNGTMHQSTHHHQSMKASKSSYSKNSRLSYQQEALF